MAYQKKKKKTVYQNIFKFQDFCPFAVLITGGVSIIGLEDAAVLFEETLFLWRTSYKDYFLGFHTMLKCMRLKEFVILQPSLVQLHTVGVIYAVYMSI